MRPEAEAFVEEIRQFRDSGESLLSLAGRLGIDQRQLRRWLDEGKAPSADSIDKCRKRMADWRRLYQPPAQAAQTTVTTPQTPARTGRAGMGSDYKALLGYVEDLGNEDAKTLFTWVQAWDRSGRKEYGRGLLWNRPKRHPE